MHFGVRNSRLVSRCIVALLLITLSSGQSANSTESTSAATTTPPPIPTPSPSSSITLNNQPSTQTLAFTTTVVPCSVNATTSCAASFSKYFMPSVNTSLNESQSAAFCNFPLEPSSCGGSVNVSCNTTTVESSNSSVNLYGLMCTSTGTLKVYWINDINCNLAQQLNSTMSVLCGIPGNKLNCSTSSSGYYSASRATLVKQIQTSTCVVKPTTPTPLPLLPNPVGPAAITAIVVLVCLFITAVLAGFFFWPKCHIADPAAHLVKKAMKPAAAAAASSASRPAAGAQPPASVAYDAHNNAATVKLPPTHGPSAA